MQKTTLMQQEAAEIVAIQALTWLAADDEMLQSFLGATGAGVDDLRDRAQDVAFLGAILDFLLINDDWVIGFCDANGLPYSAPMSARQCLPGGEAINWT